MSDHPPRPKRSGPPPIVEDVALDPATIAIAESEWSRIRTLAQHNRLVRSWIVGPSTEAPASDPAPTRPEAAPSGLPLVRTGRKGRKYIVVNGRKRYEPPEWASKAYELWTRGTKQEIIAKFIEKEERISCNQSMVSRTIDTYELWNGLGTENLCKRK